MSSPATGASASMAGVISEMKRNQHQKAGTAGMSFSSDKDRATAGGEDEVMVGKIITAAPATHAAQAPTLATVVQVHPQGSAAAAVVGREALGTPIYGDDVECAPILKEKFVTQGYKDIGFAVVFILQLAATFVVAMYNLHNLEHNLHEGTNVTTTSSTNAAHAETREESKSGKFLSTAFFLSIAVCLFMMVMMRLHAKTYIWGANILSILLWISCGLFIIFSTADDTKRQRGSASGGGGAGAEDENGFTGGSSSGSSSGDAADGANYSGVLFFVFAAIHIVWLWFARNRVPFAAVLLKQSVKTTMTNWGTYLMSFAQLIFLIVYMVVFICMLAPILEALFKTSTTTGSSTSDNAENQGPVTSSAASDSPALTSLLLCFILLLWFWTVQVMVNVVHVTASGSVATWYFAGDDNMPPRPTVAAAKRATTTSFGSICFGSLLVAILKVIQAVLRASSRRANFAAIVARCLLALIERLMRYFNSYAFTHVAVYGMDYISAGKATWAMVKSCGWSALFNDNLVYPVLNMTCFIDSLVIGVVLGLASDSVLIGIECGLVSYVVHIIMFRVVYSGIITMFVCTAECEDVLAVSNPLFHAEVQAAKGKFLSDQANTQAGNSNVWV